MSDLIIRRSNGAAPAFAKLPATVTIGGDATPYKPATPSRPSYAPRKPKRSNRCDTVVFTPEGKYRP